MKGFLFWGDINITQWCIEIQNHTIVIKSFTISFADEYVKVY